jgi:hypothetical protein
MSAHHNLALSFPPEAGAPPPAGAAAFSPRFVAHDGVEVLRLDYTRLSPPALCQAFTAAGQLISSHPPGSLRILTLLDSSFDGAAAEALKRYAVSNGPFVRASAVLAVGFWSAVVVTIKLHQRHDLRLFGDEAAALAWLSRS